jgi:hypothetical protein
VAVLSRGELNWVRLARRAVIAAVVICASAKVCQIALSGLFGYDFAGIWRAGHDVSAGRSPYLTPDPRVLLGAENAFIPPPPLAILAIPFSVLPFTAAVVLWDAVCVGALAAAMRLLGVRDRRLYVLALCSLPFVSSLVLGQPSGLLALAAVVAWRWRDSWKGAIAVGALIAAKLFGWPLLIWLLVTGRIRSFWIAVSSTAGLLALSWSAIAFRGFIDYPQLLSADAHAFERRSLSLVSAAMRLGASRSFASVLAVVGAVVVGLVVVRAARGSDLGWFTAALTLGLLISPIMWTHYLVLLFVPLAISRQRLDWVWLLVAPAFWISPVEPGRAWQVDLVLLMAVAVAVVSVQTPRPTGPKLGPVTSADLGASGGEPLCRRGVSRLTDAPHRHHVIDASEHFVGHAEKAVEVLGTRYSVFTCAPTAVRSSLTLMTPAVPPRRSITVCAYPRVVGDCDR